MVKYQLIRSNRHTLAIQITEHGVLIARAPLKLSIKKIEDFITKKQNWIEKKQQNISVKINAKKLSFNQGDKFYYLGNLYSLIIKPEQIKLIFNGNNFVVAYADKITFNTWYLQQFADIVLNRVQYYANKYSFEVGKISIRQQKSRWGSCSGKNNISLNYLLMMTPMFVIDYVIIHELSHIIHKNHSKDFWHLVQGIMPNYKNAEQYLKTHGSVLQQFRV